MGALGLHRLVPRNLLAGRWLVVLVCYLDDSGKDPQNRITNIAGYVAREEEWKAFESEVEPWFSEFNVKILHAKDLQNTDNEFKDWKVLRKQAFVARIYQAMRPHVPLGVACGAVKETYAERAKERQRRTVTPYSFCFNVIVDWLLRDVRLGKEIHHDGLSFILECGHENNPEAQEQFYKIRTHYGLEKVLRSISFVPKDECRAIQTADLLAFYSRRHGAALEFIPEHERLSAPMEPIASVVVGSGIPHYTFVATDFDPNWRPSPFSENPGQPPV